MGTGTDQRADIYALGATFYTLLTGQKPASATERVAEKPLIPPGQLIEGLPDWIEAMIVQALELNPKKRPQTVKEFALGLMEPATTPPVLRPADSEKTQLAEPAQQPKPPAPVHRDGIKLPPGRPRAAAKPGQPRRWLKPLAGVAIVGLMVGAYLEFAPRQKTDSVFKTESVYQDAPPKTEPVLKTGPVSAPFGIEMVPISGGTFQMGCGPKDGDCETDEKPRHEVTVRGFAIGRTEITQGQWKKVMGAPPPQLYFKDCGDDCPVEDVSWNDAQAFIKEFNRKTGQSYRLPTEAEWEYACRAGQETLYCGGDDLDALAWYGYEKAGKTTRPVKGKQPNAFGLYDMSGNVWEWVQDCYHDSYQGAPADASPWDGTNCAGGRRVIRGGSWYSDSTFLRPATRFWNKAGNRDVNLGFRLAQDL